MRHPWLFIGWFVANTLQFNTAEFGQFIGFLTENIYQPEDPIYLPVLQVTDFHNKYSTHYIFRNE